MYFIGQNVSPSIHSKSATDRDVAIYCQLVHMRQSIITHPGAGVVE